MTCLICNEKESQSGLSPLNLFESGGSAAAKDSSLMQAVSSDLSVIFVVRNMLGISSEFCEYLIFTHGNPSSWGLGFCSICRRIIQEAQYISERIRILVDEYRGFSKKLKEVTLSSFEAESKKTARSNRGSTHQNSVISQEIRIWFQDANVKNEFSNCKTTNTPLQQNEILPATEKKNRKTLALQNKNKITPAQENKNVRFSDNFNTDRVSISEDEQFDDSTIIAFDDIDDDDDEAPGPSSDIHCQNIDEEEYKFENGQVLCPMDDCEKTFDSVLLARVHVKRNHEGDPKPYECQICGKKFPRPSSLQQHGEKSHKEGLVPCPINCGMDFESEFLAEVHARRVHDRDRTPFHCQLCKSRFSRPSTLEKHIKQKHKGAKKPRKTKWKPRPIMEFENISIMPEIGNQVEGNDDDLWGVEVDDERLSIKLELPEVLDTEENADVDDPAWNPDSGDESNGDADEWQDCNATKTDCEDNNDSKINVHLTDSGSSKIGIEPVLTKASGSSETVKGKVACNICGRKFATSLLASAHEKRYHEGDQYPYRCKKCEMKFQRPSTLKNHMKEKHGEFEEETVDEILIKNVKSISETEGVCDTPESNESVETKTPSKRCIDSIKRKPLNESDLEKSGNSDSDEPDNDKSPEWKPRDRSQPTRKKLRRGSTYNKSGKSRKVHSRKFGRHSADKFDYKCMQCFRTFFDQTRLDAHILRNHQGDRYPYLCDLCDVKCTRLVKLLLHKLRCHHSFQHNAVPVDQEGEAITSSDSLNPSAAAAEPKSSETNSNTLFTPEDVELLEAMDETVAKMSCDKCSVKCKSKLQLAGHMKRHLGILKGYECPRCKKAFMDYEGMLTHCVGHLNQSANLKCTESDCKKTFVSVMRRDAHVQSVHLGEKLAFKCTKPNCSQRYGSMERLYAHIRTKHNCTPGGEEYKLRGHPLNSISKLPLVFKCLKCQLRFPSRLSMETHLRKIHTGKEYPCKECSLKFSDKPTRKQHIALSHPKPKVICDQCGMDFLLPHQLKTHIRLVHLNLPRVRLTVRKFMCEICAQEFTQKKILEHHQAQVHHDQLGVDPLKCKECDKIMNNPRSLKNHMNMVHLKKDYRFLCTVEGCTRGFMEDVYLKNHIRVVHTFEKPFKCNQCDKSFATQCYLKNHYVTHSAVKPYNCKVCQKSFSDCSTFKRHMETHGSTVHECPTCGKQFKVRHAFQLHLKSHSKSPGSSNRRNTTRRRKIKDREDESESEEASGSSRDSEQPNLEQQNQQSTAAIDYSRYPQNNNEPQMPTLVSVEQEFYGNPNSELVNSTNQQRDRDEFPCLSNASFLFRQF